MKLTKSFEQGVCLMAILATQARLFPSHLVLYSDACRRL